MPTKLVIGLQWGDEGKGKVVDSLVHEWADVCIRYQGGPNAGHTIYDDEGNKYVTHALPSGILKKGCLNIISKGCVMQCKCQTYNVGIKIQEAIYKNLKDIKLSDLKN
jgi:adenylosuccinate synthase